MPAGIFGQLALLLDASCTPARGAGRADDRSRAAALPAGPRDGEEALLIAQLAAAVALRACLRLGSRRGAGALARFARFLPRNLNRRLDAFGGFVERDLEVVAQIRAALRAAAAALSAEHLADAEDVAEAAEDVFEAGEDARIESAGAGRALDARVAVPIVGGALVTVRENRVRLGALLEAFFRFVIARVAVGVVLQRELAIRALGLAIGGGSFDGENLVVVALVPGLAQPFATFTIAGRSSLSPSM